MDYVVATGEHAEEWARFSSLAEAEAEAEAQGSGSQVWDAEVFDGPSGGPGPVWVVPNARE